jgi:hypothetical protein
MVTKHRGNGVDIRRLVVDVKRDSYLTERHGGNDTCRLQEITHFANFALDGDTENGRSGGRNIQTLSQPRRKSDTPRSTLLLVNARQEP